jgi:prophage regulatory protein
MSSPSLLRRPVVSKRTGLSRSTLYRMVQSGEFPAPRQIGARAVAWVESEVSAWIESRATGTRSTGPQAV